LGFLLKNHKEDFTGAKVAYQTVLDLDPKHRCAKSIKKFIKNFSKKNSITLHKHTESCHHVNDVHVHG
jgi:hypothetical protein